MKVEESLKVQPKTGSKRTRSKDEAKVSPEALFFYSDTVLPYSAFPHFTILCDGFEFESRRYLSAEHALRSFQFEDPCMQLVVRLASTPFKAKSLAGPVAAKSTALSDGNTTVRVWGSPWMKSRHGNNFDTLWTTKDHLQQYCPSGNVDRGLYDKFCQDLAVWMQQEKRPMDSSHHLPRLVDVFDFMRVHRKIEPRKDWDRIKRDLSLRIQRVKFADRIVRIKPNSHNTPHELNLWQVLSATGQQPLCLESKVDEDWGVGRSGNGDNLLGEILMLVRGDTPNEARQKAAAAVAEWKRCHHNKPSPKHKVAKVK
jgi:predicted NAD-dependent protein-ADP-ribosyltransferase YbiA (DUF1768 family)